MRFATRLVAAFSTSVARLLILFALTSVRNSRKALAQVLTTAEILSSECEAVVAVEARDEVDGWRE